jgi:hypothetical protein
MHWQDSADTSDAVAARGCAAADAVDAADANSGTDAAAGDAGKPDAADAANPADAEAQPWPRAQLTKCPTWIAADLARACCKGDHVALSSGLVVMDTRDCVVMSSVIGAWRGREATTTHSFEPPVHSSHVRPAIVEQAGA